MHLCLRVYVCIHRCQSWRSLEEGVRSPGAGIPIDSEPTNVGAGKQTQVLRKGSIDENHQAIAEVHSRQLF